MVFVVAQTDMVFLKSEFQRLAELIDLPQDKYPKFEMPAEPTFDYDDYIVIEDNHYLFYRGEPQGIFPYVKTDSLDELFYFVFKSITDDLAESMSIKEYQPKVEVRRYIWSKQLKLMNQLSPKWSQRLAANISEILAKHPPQDGRGDIAKQIQLGIYLKNTD